MKKEKATKNNKKIKFFIWGVIIYLITLFGYTANKIANDDYGFKSIDKHGRYLNNDFEIYGDCSYFAATLKKNDGDKKGIIKSYNNEMSIRWSYMTEEKPLSIIRNSKNKVLSLYLNQSTLGLLVLNDEGNLDNNIVIDNLKLDITHINDLKMKECEDNNYIISFSIRSNNINKNIIYKIDDNYKVLWKRMIDNDKLIINGIEFIGENYIFIGNESLGYVNLKELF